MSLTLHFTPNGGPHWGQRSGRWGLRSLPTISLSYRFDVGKILSFGKPAQFSSGKITSSSGNKRAIPINNHLPCLTSIPGGGKTCRRKNLSHTHSRFLFS